MVIAGRVMVQSPATIWEVRVLPSHRMSTNHVNRKLTISYLSRRIKAWGKVIGSLTFGIMTLAAQQSYGAGIWPQEQTTPSKAQECDGIKVSNKVGNTPSDNRQSHQTSQNQRLPVISARRIHERTTFDFRPRPLKSKLSIHRANSVSGKMESNITHGGPQTSPSNLIRLARKDNLLKPNPLLSIPVAN